MFRFVLAQIAGAFLTRAAASGRYSRGISAVLGVIATRMGGPSTALGIWGSISALARRGR